MTQRTKSLIFGLRDLPPAEQLHSTILEFREQTVIIRHFDLLGIDTTTGVPETSVRSYATGE